MCKKKYIRNDEVYEKKRYSNMQMIYGKRVEKRTENDWKRGMMQHGGRGDGNN